MLDLSDAVDIPIGGWKDAERLGFRLMLALGFENVQMTGNGSDGGVDVVCPQAVCQVKAWTGAVGRPEIQRVVGAAEGREVLVLAKSFTVPAIRWADGAVAALFSYDEFAHVRGVNSSAVALLEAVDLPALSAREQELAKRVRRAQRQTAAIKSAADEFINRPALGWRARRRQQRVATQLKRALSQLQERLVSVQNAANLKAAPLPRLDYRLTRLEAALKSAAKHLALRLPD